MSIVKEFREFAVKGNVVDLAVGVIIGAAFGKIVSSLVEDVAMPVLGMLLGGLNFSGLAVSFVSAAAEAHFRLIEKRRRLILPREQIAGFEPTESEAVAAAAAARGGGGIKGKRPSKKDKLRAAAARDRQGP